MNVKAGFPAGPQAASPSAASRCGEARGVSTVAPPHWDSSLAPPPNHSHPKPRIHTPLTEPCGSRFWPVVSVFRWPRANDSPHYSPSPAHRYIPGIYRSTLRYLLCPTLRQYYTPSSGNIFHRFWNWLYRSFAPADLGFFSLSLSLLPSFISSGWRSLLAFLPGLVPGLAGRISHSYRYLIRGDWKLNWVALRFPLLSSLFLSSVALYPPSLSPSEGIQSPTLLHFPELVLFSLLSITLFPHLCVLYHTLSHGTWGLGRWPGESPY